MEIPEGMKRLFEPGEWAMLTGSDEFVSAVRAIQDEESEDEVLRLALELLAKWRN
jgi:hypothetical protein